MAPRTGQDGCGKSRPHRASIPEPSSPKQVAIATELILVHKELWGTPPPHHPTWTRVIGSGCLLIRSANIMRIWPPSSLTKLEVQQTNTNSAYFWFYWLSTVVILYSHQLHTALRSGKPIRRIRHFFEECSHRVTRGFNNNNNNNNNNNIYYLQFGFHPVAVNNLHV
jgi:hypothetical protein